VETTDLLKLKKDEVLFEEGSPSDCAYIIQSGRLEVSKAQGNGGREIVGFLEAGDIVGEMGLIDGQVRSATVRAAENTQLTQITREHFQILSKRHPAALMPILKVLSARLRSILTRVPPAPPA